MADTSRLVLTDEHLRGREIPPLHASAHGMKRPLQNWQHARSELIHEKLATGLEHIPGFAADFSLERHRHAPEWDTRDDVSGPRQIQPVQHRLHFGSGFI